MGCQGGYSPLSQALLPARRSSLVAAPSHSLLPALEPPEAATTTEVEAHHDDSHHEDHHEDSYEPEPTAHAAAALAALAAPAAPAATTPPSDEWRRNTAAWPVDAVDAADSAGSGSRPVSLTDSSLRQTLATTNFWLIFFTVPCSAGMGCNRMQPGLQPHATRAATVRCPGCSFMY